jgi:hypothetical protein
MNRGAMNLEFGKPFHNKTVDQCRTIGRRGGLARSRNLRLRRSCHASPLPAPAAQETVETAQQASLLLDAEYPWLRDAFRRRG